MKVEHAIVVFQATGPVSATVTVAAIEVVTGAGFNFLQWITAIFPIDQIMRLQDCSARKSIHGGADHIINIADPDYIRIRKISRNDWIGVRSVTIIAVRLKRKIGP